jgi:hypothetical protein
VTLQLIPDKDPGQDRLYITMFYDRFPDRPITLPLKKAGENTYRINMPSYAYKGYLYYAIGKDSVNAVEYLVRVRISARLCPLPLLSGRVSLRIPLPGA